MKWPTPLVRLVEHIGAIWFVLRARITGDHVDASKVNPQLWTGGGIENAADVVWLQGQGITADIDCREEYDDRPLTATLKLDTYWAPQTDDGQPKPASWFLGAWGFAKPVLDTGGVVYAHCASGINRGPSMAAFLLMAYWGLTSEQAGTMIRLARPEAQIAYLEDAERAAQSMNHAHTGGNRGR